MNRIILIGNPNVGKTTLFNTLTSSNEKASNWHGVTVDSKSKIYKFNNQEFEVTDLPGLYSLDGFSNEEKIASRYLLKHKGDLIINICDANNLTRNLKLTDELIKNSYNVILAVNMVNDFYEFDEDLLSKILGIKVIGIDARKTKSVNNLKTAIFTNFNEKSSNFIQKSANNRQNLQLLNSFISELRKKEKKNFSSKLDKILLNKFLFIPCFIAIIFSIFYLTFGAFGEMIMTIFNKFISIIFDRLIIVIESLSVSSVIKNFLINAVFHSVSTILSFLPQITLLLLLFNLIEDSGLISRFAFMLDGFMKKIGLTGKSLFSLMMGYGCTASAVITTRNLETSSLRKKTAILLPFSTCSAKLPIFLLISSIFFEKYKYLFVFGLYVFSIFIMVICALIYKKIIPEKSNVFVLEMPKYRIPYLKKVVFDTLKIALEFVIKIGTTILSFSILFWLLQNFSIDFRFLNGKEYTNSILYLLSNFLAKFFKPIGLNGAGIVSVLIFGLVAKELVVVGLLFVNNVSSIETLKLSLFSTSSVCFFDKKTAIIFLIFILLYSPCISAISAIRTEFGGKMAIKVFFVQFFVSYIVCFIIFNLFFKFSILKTLTLIFLFSIAIIYYFVIQCIRRKNCGGNCYACRKF